MSTWRWNKFSAPVRVFFLFFQGVLFSNKTPSCSQYDEKPDAVVLANFLHSGLKWNVVSFLLMLKTGLENFTGTDLSSDRSLCLPCQAFAALIEVFLFQVGCRGRNLPFHLLLISKCQNPKPYCSKTSRTACLSVRVCWGLKPKQITWAVKLWRKIKRCTHSFPLWFWSCNIVWAVMGELNRPPPTPPS